MARTNVVLAAVDSVTKKEGGSVTDAELTTILGLRQRTEPLVGWTGLDDV